MYWIHDIHRQEWKRAVGEWRATVRHRVHSEAWYGIVEHVGGMYERYWSTDFVYADDARTWCERQMERLNSDTPPL
jgi:hypothetical protein